MSGYDFVINPMFGQSPPDPESVASQAELTALGQYVEALEARVVELTNALDARLARLENKAKNQSRDLMHLHTLD